MSTKKIKISELIPDKKNARKHNPRNIGMIGNSLQEVGPARSIVIDENNKILAGNGTVDAAAQVGIEKIIVVDAHDDAIIAVRKTGLTEEQKTKLALYDNRTAELAEWDAVVIEELKIEGVELGEFFSDGELEKIGVDKKEIIEDEVPELSEETKTVKGDVYELGRHRVMCGDSTNSDDVAKLMDGKKFDIGFTSPPYNSGEADFTYNYKAKKQGGFYRNNKDDLTEKEYFEFIFAVLNNYLLNANSSHSIFWNVMYNANSRDLYGKYIFSVNNPLKVRETIVWNKISGFPVAGDNILSRNSELIFLLSNSEKYLSNAKKDSVMWNRWDISNANSQNPEQGHKACFPIDLPRKAIEDFSLQNMIVLDLFLGSGTTLIACEQTNRICYGMEIDEHYCDVIVSRYVKFAGNNKVKRNGKEITWELN